MSWLSRLLGYVPGRERAGIALHEREPWRVEGTADARRFLRALEIFAGDGNFAYFEDTPVDHVREYLRSISVEPMARVAMGTIWPRPDRHHVPLTTDVLEALALFLERHPAGLLCIHVLAYREGAVFLQWYDAFDDPIYLTRALPEPTIATFAKALGTRYSTGW